MTLVTGARSAHHLRASSRILVVDDESKLLGFVCRALSADGFSVDGAGDGSRALRLIHEREYELVVLDLLMEGVDGVTVLERAMKSRPGLPVLVLSALSDIDTKVRCFELGAADYLTKPFALAELRARISARLRSPAVAKDAVLSYNGFKLDATRRIVDTEKGSVRLSETEFLLLWHLIRFEGKVFSRAELLEKVWGYSFDPGTNVVDVYVARLRSKLGSSVIATVRNVGYYVPVV
jgi:two-component system copper resistance phosphate regulon response regulator CusR